MAVEIKICNGESFLNFDAAQFHSAMAKEMNAIENNLETNKLRTYDE